MTTGPSDRLDRIEAILAQVVEAQQLTQQQIDSNARAIEANSSTIAELRHSQQEASEQFRQELRQADEQFRQELRQADEQSRQRLEETAADVVSMLGSLGQQQSQTDQRFNNLLDDAREDRQANEREHNAFRELIQSLFLDIQRIWQRMAG